MCYILYINFRCFHIFVVIIRYFRLRKITKGNSKAHTKKILEILRGIKNFVKTFQRRQKFTSANTAQRSSQSGRKKINKRNVFDVSGRTENKITKTFKMENEHEEWKEKPGKILLFLSNNQIFVWDKEDVMTLRRKYRIVGSLVGSLPSKPRQNLVFCLPLVLQPEETRLLLDKNIARIVESTTTRPSEETVLKFQQERKASIQEQMERLEEIKQQKLADFAEIIEEGRENVNKKRKLLWQGCSRKVPRIESEQRKSGMESSLEHVTVTDGAEKASSDIHNTKGIDQMAANIYKSPQDIHKSMKSADSSPPNKELKNTDTVLEDVDGFTQENSKDISTSSTENSNQAIVQDSTLVCINTKSDILKTKDVNWKFPETESEEARHKVFSDLWERGYFITNGSKFGGDYLVYPGDPLRFHSHFIVKILPLGERLSGLDLVSIGRLGSTVKKTTVLASVDLSGNVVYTSVQWSGFV